MSGVENVHIPANRWRTLKSVVVWAEGEGGLLEARAVRGVMVGKEGTYCLKVNSISFHQFPNSIIIMILIYLYVVYLLCYFL